MKIYTSYFSNLKNIKQDIVPISIALYSPKGWEFGWCQDLTPPRWLLNEYKKSQDKEFYTEEFERMLDMLNIKTVIRHIKAVSKGQDVVLLCYESPEKFCHRHLVRKWFEKQGIIIEEWKNT